VYARPATENTDFVDLSNLDDVVDTAYTTAKDILTNPELKKKMNPKIIDHDLTLEDVSDDNRAKCIAKARSIRQK
jgi:hypothetical protein